ncbi:MAG: hypothetical protein IJ733_09820 [Lachnospiraceae bacterium]|nr:hypothetical protein [Lachnospiraceae bacterium]
MKDENGKTEELLNAVYHQEEEADAFNRTMIEMVKEREDMKKRGQILGEEKQTGYRRGAGKFGAVAAVFLAVLILGTGVYAATGYFSLDFMSKFYGDERGLSKEAKNLLESEPEVTGKEEKRSEEMDSVLDCEVSEVLCDSRYVVVSVNVTVKDPKKYLYVYSGWNIAEDPVRYLQIGVDSEQKINEYCTEKNLRPAQVQMHLDKETEKKYASLTALNGEQRDGKKATIMLCAERRTKDKKFQIGITPELFLYGGKDNLEYRMAKLDKLQVTVEDKSTEREAEYRADGKKEYQIPGTEITLERVKLISTEVGSYLSVWYKDERKPKKKEAYIFYLCDKEGEEIWVHPFAGSMSTRSLGNERYLSESAFESIGLPEELYIKTEEGKAGQVVRLEKVETE